MQFPKLLQLRQKFPPSQPVDIATTLPAQFAESGLLQRLRPGSRIAVAVGSRGITNLAQIVRTVVEVLKGAGAAPFIIPAMGSHGGATPEGQASILAEYGVTEQVMGVPIEASLEVRQVGTTGDGVPVYVSTAALAADGIVIVNRIKPHTDFFGLLGSGVIKMMVIGLGKRQGAANFHVSAARLGYEHVLRTASRVIVQKAPILGGVGILEDQYHQTHRLAVMPAHEIESRENELFLESRALLPKLPFSDIDLLIVDRIGKNISGAGMDPNVIGRSVHGYSSFLGQKWPEGPIIRRIFVREMTPETHGNANGVGLADATTARLVRGIDPQSTYINALTALAPQGSKIPIYFETDREVLTHLLPSTGVGDLLQTRIVHIADTLNVERMAASEAYLSEIESHPGVEKLSDPEEMSFDAAGNLSALSA